MRRRPPASYKERTLQARAWQRQRKTCEGEGFVEKERQPFDGKNKKKEGKVSEGNSNRGEEPIRTERGEVSSRAEQMDREVPKLQTTYNQAKRGTADVGYRSRRGNSKRNTNATRGRSRQVDRKTALLSDPGEKSVTMIRETRRKASTRIIDNDVARQGGKVKCWGGLSTKGGEGHEVANGRCQLKWNTPIPKSGRATILVWGAGKPWEKKAKNHRGKGEMPRIKHQKVPRKD